MVQLRAGAIKRDYVVAFALLFNTFSWYFLGRAMVNQVISSFNEASFEYLLLSASYPASIIISAMIGAILFAKVNRRRFFWTWLLLGVFTGLGFLIPGASSLVAAILISLLGVSIGIGMPACLSYFKDSVTIENRGKTGGIILFATLFGAPIIFMGLSTSDFSSSSVIFASWRAWGLVIPFFLPKKTDQTGLQERKKTPFSSVLRSRTFQLYFAAWSMFALVDVFEATVINLAAGDEFLIIIEPISAGFSTLIAGILSDWVGRKRVLIFGFVSLGIAYSAVGLLPQVWISRALFFVIDGVALGSLWVLFILVLWGDMSQNGSEKFYAIGETPFFLTEILTIFLAPSLALIPETSAFSLAAFFLFLTVLPLLFAPETLPEKSIRERELKIYIDTAKKIKEKYA